MRGWSRIEGFSLRRSRFGARQNQYRSRRYGGFCIAGEGWRDRARVWRLVGFSSRRGKAETEHGGASFRTLAIAARIGLAAKFFRGHTGMRVCFTCALRLANNWRRTDYYCSAGWWFIKGRVRILFTHALRLRSIDDEQIITVLRAGSL